MHPAWQIAPAPALFLAGPDAASWTANEAARGWAPTAGWDDGAWQQFGKAIARLVVVGSLCGRGAGPAAHLDWRAAACDGGWLVWLSVAEGPAVPNGAGEGPSESSEASQAWQARLKDLRDRLDVAQEFGRIGIWERDPQTGHGRWDAHSFRLFGIDPLAGTPDFFDATECIHPDDREPTRAAYQASLQHPGNHECHYRVIQPDGTVMRLHSRWRVEASVDGRPQRVIGILADETERFAALQRHALSVQQLGLAGGLVGISLWRLDLATQRIQLNPAGYERSGFMPEPEGVPVERIRSTIHPDDREAVERAAAEAIRSTGPVDVRSRYRDRNGRYADLLTRRIAQRDDNGRVVALLGVSMDMTQQVADRARSDAYTARMNLVAEATGIGVWSYDLDSRERHWNGRMRRLFGLTDDAPIPSLRARLLEVVDPEDRDKVLVMVRQIELGSALALAPEGRGTPRFAGAPADAEVVEVEFRIRLPDRPVRWVVSRTQVLRQGAQAIAHGVVIDVTEFRATQVELKLARSRVELAAQAAGIGTWEMETDVGLHHWDEQMYRLRGLSPDDPRPVPELILSVPPPEDDPQVAAKLAAALHSGKPYANEFRVRWPDGSVHWLASRGMTAPGADGKPSRMFGINWDITEQKRAEQMLREKLTAEEASRAKSEFLARMSHELRTPLNAVLGFAELLCAAPPSRIGSQERGHAELIRSAGRHLMALIDDVLDLARIDANRLPLAHEAVSLDAVLSDVVRWVQPEARAAAVTVHAAASGRWVRGDAKSLRQVFSNLLSNGIKYNRAGGSVQVRAATVHGAWTEVRVVDTGRGMAPEQLAHLFEPFNRLGAEGGEIQGTGIGLAIVHQLVERMGGRIAVRSALGQGAEFSLSLPSAEPAPVAVPVGPATGATAALPGTASPAEAAPPAESIHTAIYIEDNPVNLLLVRELFERKPAWRLHTAVTGAEGIAETLRLQPRLALIDMQLPDMDGHAVLARLHAEPSLRGLRCIALSANAMPDDVLRARAAGFDDYWTKPIDFQAFLTALDTLAATAPA